MSAGAPADTEGYGVSSQSMHELIPTTAAGTATAAGWVLGYSIFGFGGPGLGFWLWSLGFEAWGLGFGVWGLGDLRSRVSDFGLRDEG